MTRYKAELETELIKRGNKYLPKLKELHLTKEQIDSLYNSLNNDTINKDRFTGVTIYIGDKIK